MVAVATVSVPRIVLRPAEVQAIFRAGASCTVKVYVAAEDWEPFIAGAYEGMQIPVRMEGRQEPVATAVLTRADHLDQSITVVI